jgi:addiction module HigA family antidote
MNNHTFLMLHPGRIILEEFLAPRGISVFRLANEIGVSPRRLYEIVQGQRSISADLAHRLAHYFGMSERYWLDLQAQYNLSAANDVYRKITVNRCLTAAK